MMATTAPRTVDDVLPGDVWSMVLDGVDAHGRRFLDAVWRPWAAAVCRMWYGTVRRPSSRTIKRLDALVPLHNADRYTRLMWHQGRLLCASLLVVALREVDASEDSVVDIDDRFDATVAWMSKAAGIRQHQVVCVLAASNGRRAVDRALEPASWAAALETLDDDIKRGFDSRRNSFVPRGEGISSARTILYEHVLGVASAWGAHRACRRLLPMALAIDVLRKRDYIFASWGSSAARAGHARTSVVMIDAAIDAQWARAPNCCADMIECAQTADVIEAMLDACTAMSWAMRNEIGFKCVSAIHRMFRSDRALLQRCPSLSSFYDRTSVVEVRDARGPPYDPVALLRRAIEFGAHRMCARLWRVHGRLLAAEWARTPPPPPPCERALSSTCSCNGVWPNLAIMFAWMRDGPGFVPDAEWLNAMEARSHDRACPTAFGSCLVASVVLVWPREALSLARDALLLQWNHARGARIADRLLGALDDVVTTGSHTPFDLWSSMADVVAEVAQRSLRGRYDCHLEAALTFMVCMARRCGSSTISLSAIDHRKHCRHGSHGGDIHFGSPARRVGAQVWQRWCRVRPLTVERLGLWPARSIDDIDSRSIRVRERAIRRLVAMMTADRLVIDDPQAKAFCQGHGSL